MPDKEPREQQKYERSEILSNWLRYEDLPPEDSGEEGEDYLIGEDFSTILEQQGKAPFSLSLSSPASIPQY